MLGGDFTARNVRSGRNTIVGKGKVHAGAGPWCMNSKGSPSLLKTRGIGRTLGLQEVVRRD